MPSSKPAEIIVSPTPDQPLAEVIELPHVDPQSYYSRNSGTLPRLDQAKASDYNRSGLPSPVAPEPDTFVNRVKELILLHRPAWLSH
jgi:hypothetical protein